MPPGGDSIECALEFNYANVCVRVDMKGNSLACFTENPKKGLVFVIINVFCVLKRVYFAGLSEAE